MIATIKLVVISSMDERIYYSYHLLSISFTFVGHTYMYPDLKTRSQITTNHHTSFLLSTLIGVRNPSSLSLC